MITKQNLVWSKSSPFLTSSLLRAIDYCVKGMSITSVALSEGMSESTLLRLLRDNGLTETCRKARALRKAEQRQQRQDHIALAVRVGQHPAQIARGLGVSVRTVYRILATIKTKNEHEHLHA